MTQCVVVPCYAENDNDIKLIADYINNTNKSNFVLLVDNFSPINIKYLVDKSDAVLRNDEVKDIEYCYNKGLKFAIENEFDNVSIYLIKW